MSTNVIVGSFVANTITPPVPAVAMTPTATCVLCINCIVLDHHIGGCLPIGG